MLSGKRSQYYYVAITQVESYALTKQFLFNKIFPKYPGLHNDMLSQAFCYYKKEFSQPCEKKRFSVISKLNEKLQYSQVQPRKPTFNALREMNKQIFIKTQPFVCAPLLQRIEHKNVVNERQKHLQCSKH